MIDTLLSFGQQHRVPIGIEYIDRAAFTQPIDIYAWGRPEQVIRDIISPLGYTSYVDGMGVVVVTHEGEPRGRHNLLNLRIPRFSIPDTPISIAVIQLSIHVHSLLRPGEGFAGDYLGGDDRFRTGPFILINAPIRQILNWIVGQRRNGAWVVQQAPWNMGWDPSYGAWKVFEYNASGCTYSRLLEVWGLGLR